MQKYFLLVGFEHESHRDIFEENRNISESHVIFTESTGTKEFQIKKMEQRTRNMESVLQIGRI